MNCGRYIILGGLLIVASLVLADPGCACPPAKQTPPIKPWHVTELKQEGVSLCGQGTWYFNISWKPVLQGGTPWQKYQVAGSKCTKSNYTCTAERCTAEISGCSTKTGATWAGVTADFGTRISGMRLSTICKPPSCGL